MARLEVCPIPNIWPSALALATASMPMLPPAPGLLSITNVQPVASPILLASSRDNTSVLPPGGVPVLPVLPVLPVVPLADAPP